MIQIGFKTNPRTAINVMDQVTSRMSVGERQTNANEITGYLRLAMRRISAWEAGVIRNDAGGKAPGQGFNDAEADALSPESVGEDWLLHCDRDQAQAHRSPYDTNWVFNRLLELATNRQATVWLWEILFDDNRARGRTRIWERARGGSGRATGVQVFVNTTGSAEDKGFTLIHELCVHAWRLVAYGDSRTTADHFGRSTRHWNAYHVEIDPEGYEAHRDSPHSLADHEADLLQQIREGRPPIRPELGAAANQQHDESVRALMGRIMRARRRSLSGECLDRPDLVWRLYSPSRVGSTMRRCGPQGSR